MCSTIGTLIIIAMFCVDSRLEIHPAIILNNSTIDADMPIEELQRRENYHHAINATILSNYRAIAYKNLTNAALGNEGPIGYVDFNNEDGNALLGLFAFMNLLILWFTCVCWNFGSAGLDLAYDAEVIFKTLDGAVSKSE